MVVAVKTVVGEGVALMLILTGRRGTPPHLLWDPPPPSLSKSSKNPGAENIICQPWKCCSCPFKTGKAGITTHCACSLRFLVRCVVAERWKEAEDGCRFCPGLYTHIRVRCADLQHSIIIPLGFLFKFTTGWQF